MATIDLKNFSDEDLSSLNIQVIQEQENRERLKRIPKQITQMREQYVALGGDLADLDAIPS